MCRECKRIQSTMKYLPEEDKYAEWTQRMNNLVHIYDRMYPNQNHNQDHNQNGDQLLMDIDNNVLPIT